MKYGRIFAATRRDGAIFPHFGVTPRFLNCEKMAPGAARRYRPVHPSSPDRADFRLSPLDFAHEGTEIRATNAR